MRMEHPRLGACRLRGARSGLRVEGRRCTDEHRRVGPEVWSSAKVVEKRVNRLEPSTFGLGNACRLEQVASPFRGCGPIVASVDFAHDKGSESSPGRAGNRETKAHPDARSRRAGGFVACDVEVDRVQFGSLRRRCAVVGTERPRRRSRGRRGRRVPERRCCPRRCSGPRRCPGLRCRCRPSC